MDSSLSIPSVRPRKAKSKHRCGIIPVALQGSLRRIPQFLYRFKDPVADLVFDDVPKSALASKIYLFI
jgi:hypothetical protein